MKPTTIALALLATLGASVPATWAQPARGQGGAAGGGVFALPPGVKRIISIDAHNMLMVEVERDGKSAYTTMPARHVYSGGLARLFGGTSIPTAQFISPAAGGMGGQMAGRGAGGGIGMTGIGGGFGNQGFGNQGFGNQGFGGQGFGGNLGGLIGAGALGRNSIVNRQVIPSPDSGFDGSVPPVDTPFQR